MTWHNQLPLRSSWSCASEYVKYVDPTRQPYLVLSSDLHPRRRNLQIGNPIVSAPGGVDFTFWAHGRLDHMINGISCGKYIRAVLATLATGYAATTVAALKKSFGMGLSSSKVIAIGPAHPGGRRGWPVQGVDRALCPFHLSWSRTKSSTVLDPVM